MYPYVITVFTHAHGTQTDTTRTHTHTNRTQRGRHTHTHTHTGTDPSTHRPFYTQTLSHKDPFTKKQMLLHTNAFTHRGFYIQKLLHTDPFTHKSFYTHTCKSVARRPPKSQFHLSFGHSTRPSFHAKGLRAKLRNRNFNTCFDIKTYESEQSAANAMSSYRKCHFTADFDDRTSFRGKVKGCAGPVKIAILPQFLAIEPRFVRKACCGTIKIAISLHSFWRSKLVSCEMVAAEMVKSQFHHSFWRSNLVSCERAAFRAVSLALPRALREKWKRRKKKRAREQEGKRECEDVKM